MFFEEIEISNILDCAHVKLHFRQRQSTVYIVQGGYNCPVRRAVSAAVKFICSGQYACIESLVSFKNLHEGYVRVVLLIPKGVAEKTTHISTASMGSHDVESDSDSDVPCTSRQALAREQRRKLRRQRNVQLLETRQQQFQKVEALRDFRCSPELIEYTVDDGVKQKCSIYAFQGKFHTNIDYILQQPQVSCHAFTGNWLQFITTKLNGCMNRDEKIAKLFGCFVKLFLKNHYNERDLLPKLTTCCIIGQTALDVMLAADALKIFNDVRVAFEYITCLEYTVWFLIPYKGRYVSVEEVSGENFKFENIYTCIKLKTENQNTCREYIWSDAQRVVQDLLFIAFQLVMCFHLKSGIVYLQEELNSVKDYQIMQLVITAHLQNNGSDINFWPQKNYLQRIIEACNKMRITAIIDYPGGLPVAPINGNLIKCFKDQITGKWGLKVVNNASSCGAQQLIKTLEEGLKDYQP
ncbi:PREDICTED: protein ORD [Rhagoletis zephyria]|uniref:protein ORD n=1 Tax=Rhagoletis zephyria TaxID=28612 RepID=UPI00081159D8|nr:PREDICTED: protein ORD [Rhagoletis zephyria]XP_036339121.1 protein ORD [Rhagoletis pomonella]